MSPYDSARLMHAIANNSTLTQLKQATQGDEPRYQRYLKRFQAGEPLAYVLGELTFRGRTFKSDRRAFITDPELTHLVDLLLQTIDRFEREHQRLPRLAEFGLGGGALSISIRLERPEVSIVGIELDPSALALAKENCARHGVEISMIESDFFHSWPEESQPPDIIYGDPPWGNESDLYDEIRDGNYYHQMPTISAFPPDGGARCSVHQNLLLDIKNKGWASQLLLNIGILPETEIEHLTAACTRSQIHHFDDGINVLSCQLIN